MRRHNRTRSYWNWDDRHFNVGFSGTYVDTKWYTFGLQSMNFAIYKIVAEKDYEAQCPSLIVAIQLRTTNNFRQSLGTALQVLIIFWTKSVQSLLLNILLLQLVVCCFTLAFITCCFLPNVLRILGPRVFYFITKRIDIIHPLVSILLLSYVLICVSITSIVQKPLIHG